MTSEADVQAVDELHKKYLQITERMEGVIVGQEGGDRATHGRAAVPWPLYP